MWRNCAFTWFAESWKTKWMRLELRVLCWVDSRCSIAGQWTAPAPGCIFSLTSQCTQTHTHNSARRAVILCRSVLQPRRHARIRSRSRSLGVVIADLLLAADQSQNATAGRPAFEEWDSFVRCNSKLQGVRARYGHGYGKGARFVSQFVRSPIQPHTVEYRSERPSREQQYSMVVMEYVNLHADGESGPRFARTRRQLCRGKHCSTQCRELPDTYHHTWSCTCGAVG